MADDAGQEVFSRYGGESYKTCTLRDKRLCLKVHKRAGLEMGWPGNPAIKPIQPKAVVSRLQQIEIEYQNRSFFDLDGEIASLIQCDEAIFDGDFLLFLQRQSGLVMTEKK